MVIITILPSTFLLQTSSFCLSPSPLNPRLQPLFAMHLLTRYVLWELIKVFLTALVALTGMVVLIGLAMEAIRQGLGPLPIIRMVPYILPDSLRFSVPATILMAVCSVYGRLSASNELVATKSLGIAPMTLMWPALGLAFCVSLVAVWLNDIAVSWGRVGVQRVAVQSVEEIAYGMLRTQRSYSDHRFSINVRDVQDRTLVQPTITFYGGENSPTVLLTAQEAELQFNPDDETLSIFLIDSTIDVEGQATAIFPGRMERVMPLGDASKEKKKRESPSQVPLWRISSEMAAQRQHVDELEETLAVEAAYRLSTGDFAALTDENWRKRGGELNYARDRIHRLKTEPWRRWANGFSCFFFCLVGAPLAVKLRKSDYLTVFFMCFLPILLCYYPLLALGLKMAKGGELPPYSVWLGNAICLVVGLWLLRSVNRH